MQQLALLTKGTMSKLTQIVMGWIPEALSAILVARPGLCRAFASGCYPSGHILPYLLSHLREEVLSV